MGRTKSNAVETIRSKQTLSTEPPVRTRTYDSSPEIAKQRQELGKTMQTRSQGNGNVLVLLVSVISMLVALLAWLSPFNPIGPSPIANPSTEDGTSTSPTNSRRQDPSDVGITRPPIQHSLTNVSRITNENSGQWLHIEFYVAEGQPEYEVILPGDTYNLRQPISGFMWEYTTGSYDTIKAQVLKHIERRLAQGWNNGGFIEDWRSLSLFTP